jgi:hypothetical protein
LKLDEIDENLDEKFHLSEQADQDLGIFTRLSPELV